MYLNPGGVQQFVYLIGSFGIPLFFMINGYLLSEKNIDLAYANKKLFNYVKFIAMWTLIIGIPLSIFQHRFALIWLFVDAINGKGLLFHLWFLAGLVALYYIKALSNKLTLSRNMNFGEILGLIILLLSLLFCLNILLKYLYDLEIRDIVSPGLRVVTNGCYFILGQNIRKYKYRNHPKSLLFVFIVSIFGVHAVSAIIGNKWASTMYSSIPVLVGTVALFLLIASNSLNISAWPLNVQYVLSMSTGVWILHPFVLKAINKIHRVLFGEIGFISKLIILIITIAISCLATYGLNKLKYLSRLIKV